MGCTSDTPAARDMGANGNAVVVTGAGLVTCLGLDRPTTWSGVVAGRCGFVPLTAVESELPPGTTGGQAPPLPDDTETAYPREVAYLRAAVLEALRTADLVERRPYAPHCCGVVLGTTLHGMRNAGTFLRTHDVGSLATFLAGSTVTEAVKGLGFAGVVTTVCSACSSGLASVALAKTLLETGSVDLVIAGGYDPISEYAYGGFNSMRLVTRREVRPFSRDRDGMKLGEGYAVLVLERRRDALSRGAEPWADVLGFGESCDAHHLSKPHPDGAGAVAAVSAALRRAGLSPGDVDLIAAHATATRDNDAAEHAALSRVFGDDLRSIPVVAFKSHVGHTLGGAGAVELVLSLTALREQVVPPCANSDPGRVEFQGLTLATGEPRRSRIRHTINTSLGFGGSNTCIVLGRPAAAAAERHRSVPARVGSRDVVMTGIGAVFPGTIGLEQLRTRLGASRGEALQRDTGAVDGAELDALLHARRLRRISDYVKLTLAATTLAYRDAGIDDPEAFGQECYGLLGTTHGSTAYSERYYRQIVEHGVDSANPMLFAEGVPNAAAAHLSTGFAIKGLCQSVIGTRTAGLEAILLAAARIRAGVWERAVVGASDEYSRRVNETYLGFGLYREVDAKSEHRELPGFVTGCGAVTFVLECADSARRRGARPWASIEDSAAALCPSLAGLPGPRTIREVWSGIGRPTHLMGSANDTWLDRVERLALSRRGVRGPDARAPIVSSIYGHIGECFSAMPLAALAAVLVRGKLTRWCLPERPGFRAAHGDEECDHFGVMAADYAGAVVGVRVRAIPDRMG